MNFGGIYACSGVYNDCRWNRARVQAFLMILCGIDVIFSSL